MRAPLFLPALLVCAAGGYLAGGLARARWGDRPPAAPASAEALPAREALARLRRLPPGEAREAARRAFLQRFPRSWLRAAWEGGR